MGKEPHLVAPFLGCAVGGLSGIVVDQVCILDVLLKRRVQIGICEKSREFLGVCHGAFELGVRVLER